MSQAADAGLDGARRASKTRTEKRKARLPE
jgi:hypothetical protein